MRNRTFSSLPKPFNHVSLKGDEHEAFEIRQHRKTTTKIYQVEVKFRPHEEYEDTLLPGFLWSSLGAAYADCDDPVLENIVAEYCLNQKANTQK